MEVGVRELRNHTAQVLDAVRSGERVILTVHGEAIADIVPHAQRSRWVSGDMIRAELTTRSADADLTAELEELAGHTAAEL